MTQIIRLGVAGLGTAGRAFLPSIKTNPGFDLVAVADPALPARSEVSAATGAHPYESLEDMLAHPGLDAVYVGTPTFLHPAHVEAAARVGKHVLVEKPMAIDLAQAQSMIAATDNAGVVLLVGHSHSYDLPIKAMRDIITSGELGDIRLVNTWNYTDWVYRPRRPDELDAKQGGGVTYRQGSHQFDIIRYLCGGKAKSLRAKTFNWDKARDVVGAHTVWIDFENGAAATAVYNGYGHFSAMELCFDVTEWGFLEPPEQRKPVHRGGHASLDAELAAKQARAKHAIPGAAPNQPFFGLTLVSCERGDIRQSAKGLFVYSADGRREISLPTGQPPRDFVMHEFHDAITGTTKPIHDGRWGLANLEICAAALLSSNEGREVSLEHQVGI